MLGGTRGERDHGCCLLGAGLGDVDTEALRGELLVAGSQGTLQPPGRLWLSIRHFTLLLPHHVWGVL